jgi:small-conductance mechanosensitive channel
MTQTDQPLPSFDWDALWAMTGLIIASTPVQVLLIIVFAVAIRFALQYVIRRLVDRVVNGVKKKQNAQDTQALLSSPLAAVRVVQRTRTLGSVLTNLVTAIIVITATLSIVVTINPDITGAFALITAALGAGLGFGAQNIVKDVLSGLFIVAEDQIGVGDVVDLGPATGVVEDVGIRITKIRDVNGTLWFVRNGEILRVGNMSQGWSRVIIDLGVPTDSDLDAVQEKMLEAATALATDAKWRTRILERPEIWGIESIAEESIHIRIAMKTRSAAKDDVARELRARLRSAVDSLGVQVPALSSIVLSGFEGAASVTGARPPKTRPVQVPPAEAAPARSRAARAKAARASTAPAADPRGFRPGKESKLPIAPTTSAPQPTDRTDSPAAAPVRGIIENQDATPTKPARTPRETKNE